jgi:transposase
VLSVPPSVRVFVATQPVDGRKGPDSLMALVRDVLRQDPLSGHLFIFFSKRCDRVRVVYWDRNGYAMWTKRLEKGRFRPAFSDDGRLASMAIEAAELALIVSSPARPGSRAATFRTRAGSHWTSSRAPCLQDQASVATGLQHLAPRGGRQVVHFAQRGRCLRPGRRRAASRPSPPRRRRGRKTVAVSTCKWPW